MSILKARVSKLEASINPEATVIHIKRFIVDCCGADPIGYHCDEDGTEIMRLPKESDKDLKERCGELVVWPIGTSRHIFTPIYSFET